MTTGRDLTPVRPTRKASTTHGALLIRVSNVVLVLGLVVLVVGGLDIGPRVVLIAIGAALVAAATMLAGLHARNRARRMRG